MRIGIIGAGAVGGTLAAILERAGHSVAVTARGDHLAAIARDGLHLDGSWGTHVARVDVAPTLAVDAEGYDLVILATKGHDADDALNANRDAVAGAPLLVVQNGIGGLDTARRVSPGSPLFGGLALMAVSHLTPGNVTVTAGLPLIIGAHDPSGEALLPGIADILRTALPVEVTRDLRGAQWTKLLINHVNALPAITGWSVQDVIADSRLRRVMALSMRETVRIAARLGIRFGTVQKVPGRAIGILAWLPVSLVEAFPRFLARRMGSVPNPGSTLQSIRRGQFTEIDVLNGAVVAAAQGHNLTAPVNAEIVKLVHEVERSRQYIDPDTVASRIAGALARRES